MNSEELVEEIKKLLKDPKKRKLLLDIDEPTKYLEEYEYLWKAFENSKYRKFKKKFKFSQLVRAIDQPDSEKLYMYDRLWSLLLDFRETPDDYFNIQTEDGRYSFPNPLSELNKLEILYLEFSKIFTDIKNRIFFETSEQENIENSVRGKINWNKTILKSKTKIPTKFYTYQTNRLFETPENILLILCAEWMHRDALRISRLDFPEKLDSRQIFQLQKIINDTKNVLTSFPYMEVLSESKRYWKLDYRTDKKILRLEVDVKKRLQDGIITNKKYLELIEWIEKYKNLFLDCVTGDQTTSRPITSIEAQDYIYEAWIFFEILNFIEKKKGIRCYLKLEPYKKGKDELERFFSFKINGTEIRFYYEKFFPASETWTGYLEKPDFSVMIGKKVILVADAKNWSNSEKSKMPNAAVVDYMSALTADEGFVFFPNYPEDNFIETFTDPRGGGYSRLRFSPSNDPKLIEMRDKSLQYIFEKICSLEKLNSD